MLVIDLFLLILGHEFVLHLWHLAEGLALISKTTCLHEGGIFLSHPLEFIIGVGFVDAWRSTWVGRVNKAFTCTMIGCIAWEDRIGPLTCLEYRLFQYFSIL